MRADRLLSMLLLLQAHQRMKVSDLAKRLEVTPRTIYRDLEALGTAGIPITAERGSGGGWFLLEGYRTQLTGLTEAEVQALFVPQASRLLRDLGLAHVAETAFLKVLAALPAIRREPADAMSQRLYIDAASWERGEAQGPWLQNLQAAIWQERCLRLSYQRRDNTVIERLIAPLGLVAKASTWYLVGMVDQDLRVFRVARIQSLQITDHPCIRPPAFDLVAFWESWRDQWSEEMARQLRQFVTRVRVAPALLPKLHQAYGQEIEEQLANRAPPDAAGWIPLTLAFETVDEAVEHLIRFGPLLEVLEPQALRQQIAQSASDLLRFY